MVNGYSSTDTAIEPWCYPVCQNVSLDALDRTWLGGRMFVIAEEIQAFSQNIRGSSSLASMYINI